MASHDLVRFKELSEKYMVEVTQLEAQLEAANLKPSKTSQRPKDTVKRVASATQSKQKRVDAKQLGDVVCLLKLKLQERQIPSIKMHTLLFKSYDQAASVSIAQLKLKFEQLGVKA